MRPFRRLRSALRHPCQGVGHGDRAATRRTEIVTQRDDDFLARPERFAKPRGGGVEHGSAGYGEGLRGTRAERRAWRHGERRTAVRKAVVVGAGVMGAAVVAAAAFTVLAFAGLFTVSSGVGGAHRTVTLEQQPPGITTSSPPPSDTTDASPLSDTTEALPPSTAAQTGRSPLPTSDRVAAPRTNVSAQAPGQPSSSASGSQQLSSASSPPPSDAPTHTPSTAPPACSKGRKPHQPSWCSRT